MQMDQVRTYIHTYKEGIRINTIRMYVVQFEGPLACILQYTACMLLSVSWVRCGSCAPPPSSARQLGSPSEVAAAGTPDNKREEEHHSSDDQHKVQHTPLCMGGKR